MEPKEAKAILRRLREFSADPESQLTYLAEIQELALVPQPTRKDPTVTYHSAAMFDVGVKATKVAQDIVKDLLEIAKEDSPESTGFSIEIVESMAPTSPSLDN